MSNMIKQAFEAGVLAAIEEHGLQKMAGPVSEAVGSVLWFPVPSAVGAIAGANAGKYSKQEQKEVDAASLSNLLIPGVGAYRAVRRKG